ncbi:MAG: hypothetical protein JXR32_11095 [Anaerolineaceae bacterium]|nr:hypothetical protein [Anaerolineaceae bacterium]
MFSKAVFQRLRSSLFITAILILVVGVFMVISLNRVIDASYQSGLASQPLNLSNPKAIECIPTIDPELITHLDQLDVTWSDDPFVSLRMAGLFLADQAIRQFPSQADIHRMDSEDTQRRLIVMSLLKEGRIHSPRNLVCAAFIFQHGDCSEHYLLANQLARIAMDADYLDARWIYAASLDRYLVSQGKQQKYGTQFHWVNGEFILYPTDPNTTDAERAAMEVPPLVESVNKANQGTGDKGFRLQWFESWWLTLIGGMYALLAAAIALLEKKMNAASGWVVSAIAIVIYLVSVAGHFFQVKAMQQGTQELQAALWLGINWLMLILWLGLAALVISRGVKRA